MHEPILTKIADDMAGLVNFILADCNVIQAQPENKDRIAICGIDEMLPAVVFTTPKPKKYNEDGVLNSPEESIYGGDMVFSKLQEFAQRYIAVYRKILNSTEDLESFLNYREIPNKVILFTDYSETPHMFKGITCYLRDRLEFAEIRNTRSRKSLIERYKIKKFPTILILQYDSQTDTYVEDLYEGPKKMAQIVEYLEKFAKESKIIRSDDRGADSPVIKTITRKNYEQEILENSNFVLLHIYKKKLPHPSWSELIAGFDKVLDYYQIECDSAQNEEFAKNILGAKSFPIIKYYPSGLQKKVKTKLFFSFQDKVSDILSELNQVIDEQGVVINDQTAKNYFVEALKDKSTQLVFFGDSDYNTANIFFKALTNLEKFNSVMKFARYMQPNPGILDSLKIDSVPTIVGFLADTGKIAHFRLEMNAKNMLSFFEQIANQAHTQSLIKDQIVEIQNQGVFDQFCNPSKQDLCFIALIDAKKREEQIHNAVSELGQYLQRVSTIAQKYTDKDFKNTFLWIDISCYPESLTQVDFRNHQIPAFIAFNPNNEKFAYMRKAFTLENLEIFTNKVLTGKKTLTRHLTQEGFDFYSQLCVKKFAEDNYYQQKQDL